MQMSYQDINGSGNEPLVPTIDLSAIKRSVTADVKELRKAADLMAKLNAGAKKQPESAHTVGVQLLSISADARERARATSCTLRDALGIAVEGSAKHKALKTLSDEFTQALLKFQQQVEATTHLVPPAVPAGALVPSDIETGGGGGGWGGSEDAQTGAGYDEQHEQQMAQVATNNQLLEDRAAGLTQLNRDVHQLTETFQDLHLIVAEQGEHIDNIQTNIETANTNTTRGVKELARASRTQRKTRGRMCLMAACVLVVMIVLVLVLKLGLKSFR